MDTEQSIILGMTCYKLASLAVGSLFSLLGYRLFQSGIWGNAGDLDAKFKDVKLVLRNAAPGTFFAVIGAVIIVVTLCQGLDFQLELRQNTNILSKNPPPLPEPKVSKP